VAGDEDGIATHSGVVAYRISDDETAEHAVRLTAIGVPSRGRKPLADITPLDHHGLMNAARLP